MRGEVLPGLPECHLNPCLLDFGCLRDVPQLLVQAEDFGVFLFHDSDEIVQQGDVPRERSREVSVAASWGAHCSVKTPGKTLVMNYLRISARMLLDGISLSHAQLQGRAAWPLQARVLHRRNPGELT